MARKALPAAEPVAANVNHQALAEAGAQATELVLHDQAQQQGLLALSVQLGYDGPLSVGALEDGIRFYQRRTVEALLETGKRLLLLKELAPHGEFTQRAELLGFSERTAQRFMQAAAKTAKSANLAVLSTQVKSASAFLELVTHDDDDLKKLSELDEVDRMSASQLRAAVRELQEGVQAKDRVIENDSKTMAALREKLERPFKPRKTDPAKTAEDAAALSELFSCVMTTTAEVERLAAVVRELQAHPREPMRARALEAMQHIVMTVREIVMEHGLDVDTSADAIGGRPSWLDVDALNAANTAAAANDPKKS